MIEVFYRVSLKDKPENRPFWCKDKSKLIKACRKSFDQAWESLQYKVTTIADGPTPLKVDHQFESDQDETYRFQIQLASQSECEFVWFQEDDYLWQLFSADGLVDALEKFDFVSPYDHPEAYQKLELHDKPVKLALAGQCHWRTNTFNTMTWGCKTKTLRGNLDVFEKNGYWDEPTWRELNNRGYTLWSPIPTMATHLHIDGLVPFIPWLERYEQVS